MDENNNEHLNVVIETAGVLNYASCVNGIPIVQRLELVNRSETTLLDLTLRFSASPALIRPLAIHIAEISANDRYVLEHINLTAEREQLSSLNEAMPVALGMTVTSGDVELAAETIDLEAVAYEQWPGDRLMPQLIAAFSQPNTKATAGIQKAAARLLHSQNLSLCGYQAQSRKDVAIQISAIYSAIAQMKIDYANPPAGLIERGQRIRTPSRIASEGLGTCLDTTMLFASVLEASGLHPIVFMARQHAWVGCWLVEGGLDEVCTADAQTVRKRITSGEMIAIETTMVCAGIAAKFSRAVSEGNHRLDPDRFDDFCYAVDINRARQQRVGPLPAPGEMFENIAPESVEAPAAEIVEVVELPEMADEAEPEIQANAKTTSLRIEQWKSQLLDHSMRNRLLNCVLGKHTVRFFHPSPGELEDKFAKGEPLQCESIKRHAVDNDPRSEKVLTQHADRAYRDELALHAFGRGRLVCLHDEDKTTSMLTKLAREAKSDEEETGSNTLYFCIGALSWRPSGRNKDYMAPLLMLPARLKRRSANADFKLERHDDEPILNPTLLQVLKEQFAIEIPEIPAPHALPADDSGVDVGRILSLVQRAVSEQPHMEVRPNVVQLGRFSFAKYLMWMDLANKTDELLNHPLVNLMVEGSEEAAAALMGGPIITREHLDEELDVGDLLLVTKADASQMVVINEAARGQSLVVEGPPGTGKSETITNIIADQLGRGKRVLFVSEKMEALDVVHRRLSGIGLAPFLMVLHAAKARKSEVIQQYRDAVEAANANQASDWEALRDELRARRDKLNAYVSAMHHMHPCGLSAFGAISILATHPDWKPAEFSWPTLDTVTKEKRSELGELAKSMGVLARESGGVFNNPLSGLHATTFTPAWRNDLLSAANDHVRAFDAMDARMQDIASRLKVPNLRWSPADYSQLSALLRALVDPMPMPANLASGSSLFEVLDCLKKVSETATIRQVEGKAIEEAWIADTLKLDIDHFKLRWRAALGKIWPFSWFGKFSVRNLLKPYMKSGKRPAADAVMPALERVESVQSADQTLGLLQSNIDRLLGEFYRGPVDTNTQALEKLSTWLESVDQALCHIIGSEQQRWGYLQALIRLFAQSGDAFASTGPMGTLCQEAMRLKSEYDNTLNHLCELAGRQGDEAVPVDQAGAARAWADHVRRWPTVASRIQPWCVWRDNRSRAIHAGLLPLVAALEAQDLNPADFEHFFEFSFAHWFMNQLVTCTPVIQQFSRPLHEETIREFQELDAKFIESTRRYIFATLASNVPRSDISVPGSPMGFLRDQMTRQRNHKPIREIMQRLGPQNQKLKPCMMMSPLTVAQYLDVAETQFDVVVFDEASQIKTCDSVGVIARAPQVIVVGDPKQLPPTSFFATGSSDGEAESIDHESVLDECAAVLKCLRLSWHYRSRNEELIAFSNERYYSGELISMPAPTTEKAVKLHRVEGVYDRGKSRTNRPEAEAVVKFIAHRLLSPNTRRQSLGVVTFSSPQQDLIQDLLDRRCAENHQLERAVKGHFNDDRQEMFVKNLESVQGDQRDVILFSVTFGKTASGTVYNDFGAVNKSGGTRRLNVAVTRAAEEVHVFCSMDPEDIRSAYLQQEKSGVGDLKRYLMFARDGVSALEEYSAPTGRDVDSDFEAQVMCRLVDRGWEIHPQVGVSKFRIDLAVVDPNKPGRYIAGIECDGATYHSSATARDRDIVRQGVLESLGWNILRIWSTDWWMDANAEVERIHQALCQLRDRAAAAAAVEVVDDFDPTLVDEPVEVDSDNASTTARTGDTTNDPVATEAPEAEGMRMRPISTGEAVHRAYPAYALPRVPTAGMDIYDLNAPRVAMERAEQILDQAAPMLEEPLFRVVLASFGQTRLTARATEALSKYLQKLPKQSVNGETVYWAAPTDCGNFEGFRVGGGRSISEVPLGELANTVGEVLSHAMQGPETEIYRAVCSLHGLRRLGPDIHQRLKKAADLLISSGRAERDHDDLRHLETDLT